MASCGDLQFDTRTIATGHIKTDAPPGTSRWALAGLSLAMLMPSLATSTATAALPALAETFGASYPSAQWIVLSYLLTVTASVLAAGQLGDKLGRRRLLLAGMIVFAGGSLLCGLAPTLDLLIAARVVQGSGAAAMMALTMASVGAVVPKEKTGSAIGLLGTMSAAGTMLGPGLGGVLVAWAGPGTIFLVNVPLAAIAFLIAKHTLPKDPSPAPSGSSGFDIAGTALLAMALTAYALAMTARHGHFGGLNIALLAASAAAVGGFVAVEARASAPLIRMDLFYHRARVAGLAANLIVAAVMMTTLIVGPFYLARGLSLGPGAAGLVLAIGPLVAAMAGIPAGRLVDRFGSNGILLSGLALLAAGAVTLSVLSPMLGVAGYVAPIMGMTIGYGLFQAANSTAIMAGTEPTERGIVSGLLNLSRNLGLVTGTSAMGAIFAWGTASSDVTNAQPVAIAAGMNISFAVAAALIFIALGIAKLCRPFGMVARAL